MANEFDLDELEAELSDFATSDKKTGRTPREERIIAGFEDIQRFVEEHGHAPRHGDDNDIFERLYAVRLDRLREQEECRTLLIPLDHQGLLNAFEVREPKGDYTMTDDELLAELAGDDEGSDIQNLRHVRSNAEKREAEEIAQRERCEDFERFQPLFEQVQRELQSGVRVTRTFIRDASIEEGQFFILGGQTVYVAEVGETIKAPNGESDARLRVIYSNGTESNLLRRSLQRALYKDDAGRRITDADAGPLFGETLEPDDIESGTIYVLRSHSTHPFVAEHRELIHKIGVTGGKVETRIAGADKDATYLLADVEVVATYKLHNINRTRMENLFHRLFSPAQIELTIPDRFGNPVKPREWFLVPLHVINEAVERIRDGSIAGVIYDPKSASLRSAG
ncbi:GIY-YIG nuclease family protein [Pseudomonas aeruginosa]|uniref:GIY-YIG nuclease family protein n=1 Tax=Pseudomonas aeruginosa TaxID=287 RepID=UPI000EABF4A6|nr:GIY-YIG nuclease family protein [Pseudomonas aeruginosa]EKV8015282.1 GIY-YIG nuclease family protein [Pseudomonas aeruginosa]MBG5797630.1 GIY-YIG nuclease family protein [Pseudomonas aeruginosa]MBP8319861.1 GIY-YIG nuclease family protein [Pseudomonas aeruginosa]MBP8349637.1 GIY-YIG nuclease family protein [Pseudomonas aeruginosa]MDJ1418761.1 GIY-YIG nuclease family protein [Pseudomonas aeruginosa]